MKTLNNENTIISLDPMDLVTIQCALVVYEDFFNHRLSIEKGTDKEEVTRYTCNYIRELKNAMMKINAKVDAQ